MEAIGRMLDGTLGKVEITNLPQDLVILYWYSVEIPQDLVILYWYSVKKLRIRKRL